MGDWSIINYTNLHPGLIFDAEHYHPARIAAWKLLAGNSTKSLADFAYEIEDLSEPDAHKQSFDLTAALGQFLTQTGTSDATSVKKLAAPGDVLVSRLRSYLKEVCVVPQRSERFAPQVSTEFIVLRSPAKKSIAWLLPFILSEPVQTVLQWSQTGSNHPRFSGATLLGLPVKNSVEGLRDKLNLLIESAVREYDYSSKAYPDAEKELLDRLGWAEFVKQPPELTYNADFSKLASAGRSDAEFFQPFCHRLREHIRKKNGKRIGEFCPQTNRGVQPEIAVAGTILALDSKSIRTHGVEPSGERVTQSFYDSGFAAKARVRKDDVLLNSTGRGTLGRADCYELDAPAICDNHVAILRPDRHVCHPRYLALFLNSPAGLTQSEQFQTGSSGQLEIYPQHIRQFLVFLPRTTSGKIDMAWQAALAAKVEAATRGRGQAQAKLIEAKRLVEVALSDTGKSKGKPAR